MALPLGELSPKVTERVLHPGIPLVLGVQIDHRSALQFGQVDDVCPQHPDLLVHGDNDLQRRVGDGIVRQQRQGVSNGNAVVAAKGGTFCEHMSILFYGGALNRYLMDK